MENATTNYKNLEQEYFRTLNVMKDAEEKARIEVALLAQFETEATQLWEKVKKLESECIQAIGEAQEDGKRKVLTEVKAQLHSIFNRGFKDGWKLTFL
jgi:hypothetical protein